MKKSFLLIFALVAICVLRCPAEPVVALTSGNRLLFFDSATPGTVTKIIAVTTATGLAPTNNAESAILASLPAGNYPGIVSGKGTASGLALVEIYLLA